MADDLFVDLLPRDFSAFSDVTGTDVGQLRQHRQLFGGAFQPHVVVVVVVVLVVPDRGVLRGQNTSQKTINNRWSTTHTTMDEQHKQPLVPESMVQHCNIYSLPTPKRKRTTQCHRCRLSNCFPKQNASDSRSSHWGNIHPHSRPGFLLRNGPSSRTNRNRDRPSTGCNPRVPGMALVCIPRTANWNIWPCT